MADSLPSPPYTHISQHFDWIGNGLGNVLFHAYVLGRNESKLFKMSI